MSTILLVEGEARVRQNLQGCLNREGFVVQISTDTSEARQRLRQAMPSLVMLDVGLGGDCEAAFQLCQELRPRAPALPIVFMASRYRKADHITSLRLGADDYLAKNVSRDFLAVRLRALLRRVETLQASQVLVPASAPCHLEVDRTLMLASWKGVALKLSVTHYSLLDALIAEPGRLKTHTDLMRAAQQIVEPNTISAQIMHIRGAFRKVDPGFNSIRTERGRGYRWIGSTS